MEENIKELVEKFNEDPNSVSPNERLFLDSITKVSKEVDELQQEANKVQQEINEKQQSLQNLLQQLNYKNGELSGYKNLFYRYLDGEKQ